MIYLDNNATTAIDPEVREAMMPWLVENYGNPSAGYRFGKIARKAIEAAREQVADLIDAQPEEIVFTSCGTESNNTAIQSAIGLRPESKTLLCSDVEHSAVLEVMQHFDSRGYDHRLNPVDSSGDLDLDAWKDNVAAEGVAIASLIWANNETGVISPVERAAELTAECGVFFHTDAVQAVGKIQVSVRDLPIHALSMSAHKIYGPKGVGALFLSRDVRFQPLLWGGGQESERRSGTENVAGIVGFGKAAELAKSRLDEGESIAAKRDTFEEGLISEIPDIEINGNPKRRLPNTSNLYFPGVDGEGLLILLDEAGVCCSPGSACSTGAVQPSRIVKAMGHPSARARSSVRFSISRNTTMDEIREGIAAVRTAVGKLRVTMPSGGRVVINS